MSEENQPDVYDRCAQKREAQRRFRKNHAERIAKVRMVTNILMRQNVYFWQIEEMADAIIHLLGKHNAKELRKEIAKKVKTAEETKILTYP